MKHFNQVSFLILLFFLCALKTKAQTSANYEQELALRAYENSGFFYQGSYKASEQNFSAKMRAYHFRLKQEKENRNEVSLREFWIKNQKDKWQINFGLNEYLSFSESFGLNPLDLINASDNRDLLTETNVFRSRPQWLVQGSYFFSELIGLDLFLSPAPASQIYPRASSFSDPLKHSALENLPRTREGSKLEDRPFHEMEYGTRISLTIPSGGNVSALFYHHHNRHLAYNFVLSPYPHLLEVQKEVNSLGLNFSKDVGQEIIASGDFLYTLNDPVGLEHKNHFQSILAFRKDNPFQHIKLLALQNHYDQAFRALWLSLKLETAWAKDDQWSLSLTTFKGISKNNDDFWPKLELVYNKYPWKWETSFELWYAKRERGLLKSYDKQKLLKTTLNYSF